MGGASGHRLFRRVRRRATGPDARAPRAILKTRWALSSLVAAVVLSYVQSTARAERPTDVGIVFRILAYDSNLKVRRDKVVVVAIAYRPGDSASCPQIVQASVGEATFAGARVKLVMLPFSNGDAFESSVVTAGAAAIYVCTGLDDATGAISVVSRKNSMLTLCTVESGVRAGLSVGVATRDERRRLLVNLPATRAEGAHLSPAVLQVAEVIQ
jgi:hypothetical protein